MENVIMRKRRSGLRQRDIKNWIFIAVMAAIPMIQFAIFYIYVNFNTILLSFQEYTPAGYKFTLVNFTNLWGRIDTLLVGLKNSAILYAVTTFIGTPLTIIFSYYIYKKRPFHKTFKILLFLPTIISSLVMTLLFLYFVNYGVPGFASKILKVPFRKVELTWGLTSNLKIRPYTILFYCVWSSFGTGILMYSGAMNNISESMVEACHLDGASNIQEFWYITLPGVFPTLTTFLTASIAGFFTADMSLFAFYGDSLSSVGDLYTIGYYIFCGTKGAKTLADYPKYACLGLILTIIAMPFTFGLRALLFRLGPSTER